MNEKHLVEVLLDELLPKSVIEDFKRGIPLFPEAYEEVTIYFSDLVSFTKISAALAPMDVVNMLNKMYTVFDDISTKFDVYKVATIGDAYFVASGVPIRNGRRHALEIVKMALNLLHSCTDLKVPNMEDRNLKIRIGIHSGPCVAGVVGVKTPRYLLFGETVDIASKLEAAGEAMRVHISETTTSLMEDCTEFDFVVNHTHLQISDEKQLKTFWAEEKTP